MKKPIIVLTIVFVALCLFTGQSLFDRILDSDVVNRGARALGLDERWTRAIVKGGRVTASQMAKALEDITPENEYYLGRAVAANIAARYPVYTRDANLTAYLNRICQTIVINSPKPDIYNGYHVAVLDSQEINAFATPGGHIFVTRGLIACASNEDALAGVIAHEIAHIQLQHALKSTSNSEFASALRSGILAGSDEFVRNDAILGELVGILDKTVGETVFALVERGYPAGDEYAADKLALSLLATAGYQSSALIEMLEVVRQRQGTSNTGFGKTHPSPADRITRVNRELGQRTLRQIIPEDTRSYRTARFGNIAR